MQQLKGLAFSHINNSSSIPNNLDLQDVIISENINTTSVEDGPGIITRCKNLTVNSGITWSLTNRCQRWDIIVNGNLIVNGTISLNSLGINRAESITCKIFGFYDSGNIPVLVGSRPDAKTDFNWNHKEFTIASGGSATDGGILNIYVKGNISIGATGVISANGATGKNGGTVHVYYTGIFANAGSIIANAGTGGTVGTITVEDITYLITEYRKTMATSEYIYTIIDLGGGKALIGAKGTGKVYYTADWGLNWTSQGQLGTATCVRCFLDFGNGHVWAGVGSTSSGGAKIYETFDYGVSGWTLKATLGTQKRVSCMCNLGSGVVLAGTWDGGKIYKTVDSGLNWSDKGSINAFNARSLLYLGGNNVLLGGRTGQIYLSVNTGDTWTLKATLSGAEKVRAFLLLSNGSILVGDQKGKVYLCTGSPYTTWTLQKTFYTKQEICEFKKIIGNKILVSMSPTKTSSTDTQRHVAVTEDIGTNWRIVDAHTSSLTNSYGIERQNIFFQGILPAWINIPINHF